MKRFIFVLLMMITANVVNAQYCKICDENDEVITWKTWKSVKYDFSRCEEDGEMKNSKYRISLGLSLCRHNKFSYVKIRVSDRAENWEWDNNRDVCEMSSSQTNKNNFWVRVKKEGNYICFKMKNCTCYISTIDYPNAWFDTKEILSKASEAGLLEIREL